MRRLALLTGLLLVLAPVAAPPAGAHATIELNGERPIAGRLGTLPITIPHGCSGGLTTDRLVVRLGAAWPSARARAVPGWTASSTRSASGGWIITWVATDGGLPNASTGTFPIRVRWPRVDGIYRTPTFQHCGATAMNWNQPFTEAATADQDYPPVYPVPRIQILPAG